MTNTPRSRPKNRGHGGGPVRNRRKPGHPPVLGDDRSPYLIERQISMTGDFFIGLARRGTAWRITAKAIVLWLVAGPLILMIIVALTDMLD